PQRWLVPPVRLVNSHEKRPLGGEVRSQPVEAVQDGKRRVVSSPLDGLAEEQCPDRSSGAGKKRLALVDTRGRQAPLEELATATAPPRPDPRAGSRGWPRPRAAARGAAGGALSPIPAAPSSRSAPSAPSSSPSTAASSRSRSSSFTRTVLSRRTPAVVLQRGW